MSERKKYIHWGSKKYERDLFCKPKNERCFTKPRGGLWASPVDAEFGWRDWCAQACFRSYEKDNFFEFTLRDGAKVLLIDNYDILEGLPRIFDPMFPDHEWVCLDFEELMRQGYDAVEVNVMACRQLYWSLYGWDCDSILVMNPDVVEVYV